MKKITLCLFALFTFSGVAFAQTPNVKYGAKAGLNFANISDLSGSSNKTGFHIGGVAEIFINEKFSIQPELLYSTQGAKYDVDIDFENIMVNAKSTIKLNYLNIPIMAKYYVMDGLSLQAGPQIGINLAAEQEVKALGQKMTVKIKDNTNAIDFGLNFGAGYELPVGVFFDARYNLGLTKIIDEGETSKHRVFQVSIGYKF
ncbi:porin family protein [Myroides sp. WP-1]|uniref:porin family protein n=1 Tax=Myroides sp. WP-1 TaxID=2759944 RepID=UPI0015FB5A97|nr:porin family protein [Myroides sp. WP-1]MBB1139174.1 PorT family protein [Myroides sp. WP-1]